MIAALILALRVVLLCLAGWCLKRTGSSLIALWRGSQSLAECGRAVQTFFALSCVEGQIYFLVWSEEPLVILALTCCCIALALAIWTSKRAQKKGLRLLDAMIDRPDLTLPMIELADLDEMQALTVAQQVRQMIAVRRVDL